MICQNATAARCATQIFENVPGRYQRDLLGTFIDRSRFSVLLIKMGGREFRPAFPFVYYDRRDRGGYPESAYSERVLPFVVPLALPIGYQLALLIG